MIVTEQQLLATLVPHGLGIDPRHGRIDFIAAPNVFRRRLLITADPLRAEPPNPVSIALASAQAVASATAGHLAESGIAPLYLRPNEPWEVVFDSADKEPWSAALSALPQPVDRSELRGSVAIEISPRETPLPRVIEPLLQGLAAADAILFAPAALVVKVHRAREIWFSSPDPALLPRLDIAD